MNRDLTKFISEKSLTYIFYLGTWHSIQNFLFSNWFCPSKVRVLLLRLFGAKVGKNVRIRNNVRVHLPKLLTIDSHSWIGENVQIINHSQVTIGANVCISQGAAICSSGHDLKSRSLEYKHSPITIEDGAWICLRAILLSGSYVGVNSVVSAGETLSGILQNDHLFKSGKKNKIIYGSKNDEFKK